MLTMVDSIILEGQDVLVSEGVIQVIGKRLNPSISHEVIDGSQQYLMPGADRYACSFISQLPP